MKSISILLFLYMTVLAILPCRDQEDFGTSPVTTVQSSHQDNEKHGAESCTPFCTCSCCSTFRQLAPQQIQIIVFTAQVQKDYAEATTPSLCEQALAIWQPPQLG